METQRIDYCTYCRKETTYKLEKRDLTHTINGKDYVFKVTTAICTECGEEMAVRGWLERFNREIDEQSEAFGLTFNRSSKNRERKGAKNGNIKKG